MGSEFVSAFYQITKTIKTYNSAQSDTEVVAAVSGKAIVIDKVLFSTAVENTLILKSGTTALHGALYFTPNGSWSDSEFLRSLRTVSGAALNIATTGTGNHTLTIWTHLE